jgi:hypothetical protein
MQGKILSVNINGLRPFDTDKRAVRANAGHPPRNRPNSVNQQLAISGFSFMTVHLKAATQFILSLLIPRSPDRKLATPEISPPQLAMFQLK